MRLLRFARNDGDFRNDGILNGIASVALLPRNDGDSRNDGDFRWNFHNDGDLMGLLRLF